jgi:hypothetical protein
LKPRLSAIHICKRTLSAMLCWHFVLTFGRFASMPQPIDDRTKLAFEFAKEVTVQLITLSTGIIALEVTLLKEVFKTVCDSARLLASLSWIAFLVSILFGIATILNLTGTLQPRHDDRPATIYRPNIRIFSILQILTFILGLAFTIAFGLKTI